MMFYGRRIMRKVKTLSGQAYNGQGRKRRAVMRFAKRILNLKRDDNLPMLLKTVEPPTEYLEEMADGSDKVPPDAFCMLQGIRIFGHFEKPIFLKLCKFTEIINLNTNDLLFKIGKFQIDSGHRRFFFVSPVNSVSLQLQVILMTAFLLFSLAN